MVSSSRLRIGLPSLSTSLALRICLRICCRNKASNCSAAACNCCSRAVPMPSAAPRWLLMCWARETMLMALDHDQFGVEGTGLFQRLEDAHDIVRGGAEAVHGVDDAVQAGPFGPLEHGVAVLADLHLGARHHGGFATAEGVRLADLRVLADGHGKGAMGHGSGLDAHALA